MTGYGFGGPMTDMDTVFASKEETVLVPSEGGGRRSRRRSRRLSLWWITPWLLFFQ
jgi:hypothetical protein